MSRRHDVFHLPWPPSVNTYYRAIGGRNILSKNGREYPKKCKIAIGFYPHEPLAGRLVVLIDLFPPDRRKRDIDNHVKAILDALTKCRIWKDDSQIDVLLVNRREVVKAGKAIVTVKEAK